MYVTTTNLTPDETIAGASRAGSPGIAGYEYAGGIDPSLIGRNWPLIPGDTQGITLDTMYTEGPDGPTVNSTEGPHAQYYNGGVQQILPDMSATTAGQIRRDPDEIYSAWESGYTNPAPYQVDTNMRGPVSGHSETMNGNTLQPDFVPQGQYGAATGGGTGAHETATAYYIGQAVQVQRDYSASAFFASV